MRAFDLEIKDLRYVVAIYEAESFSQAASRLFISQPALSQAVKSLEGRLGVNLFFRTNKIVVATPEGELFVQKARQILKNMEELQISMNTQRQDQPKLLRLGVSQYYGKEFLKNVLEMFKHDVGDYNIEVIEGETRFLESHIASEEIDLGIFPAPVYSDEVLSSVVGTEEILLAVNKRNVEANRLVMANLKRGLLDLKVLEKSHFVLLRKGLKLRGLAEAIAQESGFNIEALVECENLDTLLALVEHNFGPALVPTTILTDEHRDMINFYHVNSSKRFRKMMVVYNRNTKRLIDVPRIAQALAEHQSFSEE